MYIESCLVEIRCFPNRFPFQSWQLLVGILFVAIGSLNINKQKDQTAAIILNDVILVVIFIISVVNVIISGFGIEYSSQPLRLIDQHAKTP